MFLSAPGINWHTVYEVEYADEEMMVLVNYGSYHAFDQDRAFKGKISGTISGFILGNKILPGTNSYQAEYAVVDGKKYLVEVKLSDKAREEN